MPVGRVQQPVRGQLREEAIEKGQPPAIRQR
jgi:hypothetical protein